MSLCSNSIVKFCPSAGFLIKYHSSSLQTLSAVSLQHTWQADTMSSYQMGKMSCTVITTGSAMQCSTSQEPTREAARSRKSQQPDWCFNYKASFCWKPVATGSNCQYRDASSSNRNGVRSNNDTTCRWLSLKRVYIGLKTQFWVYSKTAWNCLI